jgi:hypothetical protein
LKVTQWRGCCRQIELLHEHGLTRCLHVMP